MKSSPGMRRIWREGLCRSGRAIPGQIGVFAGLLVPNEILVEVEAALEAAIAPHRGGDGKLHITDMEATAQADLRQRLFDAIREPHLPCFWYAIYVADFHAHHTMFAGLIAGAGKDTAPLVGTIKRPKPRVAPDSLHVELFRGLDSHITAFIEKRAPGDVTIKARTTRVDTPIAKSFRQEAERLLDKTPRTSTVSSYDSVDTRS